MQSSKLSLNAVDWKKGLTHFAFYVLGAVIVAVLGYVKTIDFGQYAMVATVVIGFVGDMANKYVKGK